MRKRLFKSFTIVKLQHRSILVINLVVVLLFDVYRCLLSCAKAVVDNIYLLTVLKSRTTPYNSVTTSADDEKELEIK